MKEILIGIRDGLQTGIDNNQIQPDSMGAVIVKTAIVQLNSAIEETNAAAVTPVPAPVNVVDASTVAAQVESSVVSYLLDISARLNTIASGVSTLMTPAPGSAPTAPAADTQTAAA